MSPSLLRNALFLIWLGVFVLFINLDRLTWSFFWWVALTFWPLLLISWGWEKIFSAKNLRPVAYLSTFILIGPLGYVLATALTNGGTHENYYEYSLDKKPGWHKLDLTLKLRSNDLYLSSDPNRFVYGDFDYLLARPDVNFTDKPEAAEVTISDRDWFWPLGRWRAFRDRGWSVSVTDSVPVALSIKTGRGDVEIDARSLQLEKLSVEGPAEDVLLKLAPKAKDLNAKLALSKADIVINLPDSVGIEATGKADWSDLTSSDWRFTQKGNTFVSENFDRARVSVRFEFSRQPESVEFRAE